MHLYSRPELYSVSPACWLLCAWAGCGVHGMLRHLALLWGPCVWFPDNLETSLEMTFASHGGSFPNPGMCDQGTHGGQGCFYQVPPTPASVLCFMVLPYQLKNQHEHHQSLIATPARKQQPRVSLSCIWSIAHCTDRQPEAQGRGLAKTTQRDRAEPDLEPDFWTSGQGHLPLDSGFQIFFKLLSYAQAETRD